MTHHDQLERLAQVEAHLAEISARTGGHGVEALWLDEAARSNPRALPDALYVNRGDTYAATTLYDVAEGEYLATSWGDWLERAEAAAVVEG
jgi:hypothetical protein